MTRIEFWKTEKDKFLVVDFVDDHEESEEHDDIGTIEYDGFAKQLTFVTEDGGVSLTYEKLKMICDKLRELNTQQILTTHHPNEFREG